MRISLHVDDLLGGGQTVDQAVEQKGKSIKILEDATESVYQCVWQSDQRDLSVEMFSSS